ncbi:hypothetical protein LCGC14_0323280 [marine sediment metagenome]|uniref:Uncharacterized protein n=1 Tax=marine sediment metagenome TaxID=412755 RepID=A0A0F9TP55_9ZZZZ
MSTEKLIALALSLLGPALAAAGCSMDLPNLLL